MFFFFLRSLKKSFSFLVSALDRFVEIRLVDRSWLFLGKVSGVMSTLISLIQNGAIQTYLVISTIGILFTLWYFFSKAGGL